LENLQDRLYKFINIFRGNKDIEITRDILFDLLFFYFISNAFEKRKEEIKKYDDYLLGDEIDRTYYSGCVYLEPEYTWQEIKKTKDNLLKNIKNALEKIENSDEKYKNITNKNIFTSESFSNLFDSDDVMNIMNQIDELIHDPEEDNFGRIYEFFLNYFAKNSGKGGGEFYTPRSVVKLLINLINPRVIGKEKYVYDPCCGSAGMFTQSKKFIEENQNDNNKNGLERLVFFGQELKAKTWKLAKMNLIINNLEFYLGSYSEDVFKEDLHEDKQFDYILSNPPYNIKNYYTQKFNNLPQYQKYGIPPSNSANFAWLIHIVNKLNDNGVATVIMSNGTLSSATTKEQNIRQNFINQNLIDAIIMLPNNLFYATTIAPCVWIFNKQRKRNESILMIDATNDNFGKKLKSNERILETEDILKISNIYRNFKDKKEIDFDLILKSKIITKEEIEINNYNLSPLRYIDNEISYTKETIDKELIEKVNQLEKLINQQEDYHKELKKLLISLKTEIN
jgi:type I restriction enzyme M protein